MFVPDHMRGAVPAPGAGIPIRDEIATDTGARDVRHLLKGVMASAALAGCDSALCERVEVVLAEVLNNIVEHAYHGPAGWISLRLTCDGAYLRLTVFDGGAPMPGGRLPDARQPVAADPGADPAEGGYGWMMIRGLSSGLHYRRHRGINELTVSFSLMDHLHFR